MRKALTIFLGLVMNFVPLIAGRFYKPAEYRWVLESLDISAGLRASQPMCRVMRKGTEFPVKIKLDTLAPGLDKIGIARSVMVFRKGVTGKVVSTVVFEPRNKVELPYLPRDFYSVLLKCYSSAGNMLFSNSYCLNILEDGAASSLKAPLKIDNKIFSASVKNGKLIVNGIPEVDEKLTLHVVARNQHGGKEFEQILDVNKKNNEYKLTDIAPGQFLSLAVNLEANSKLLDKTKLFYYKKGTFPIKTPIWKKTGNKCVDNDFTVHENQALKGKYEHNIKGLNALVEGMKKRGSDMVNLGFRWNHIEPVSGVYNWENTDKYVKYFTDRGIYFGLLIGGGIFNSTPFDTWGEWMMDSKGECQLWRRLCVTSPASEKFRSSIREFVKAVHKRYGNNPCFVSWTFLGQGLDSGIFMDHFNKVTDYSPWARDELVKYLKGKYKNLEALNRAWNSDFNSWETVNPPLPDWSKPVDISQAWLDFNSCKLKIYSEANTALYDPVVRKLDKKRKASHYLTYTGPIEYLFPEMKANNTHLNDGGGEAHQMIRLYSIAANWNIRRQPESHYVPPAKRLQLQDMITNALRYGFNNYDLGMVWNSMVNIHATHYPKNKKLKDAMKFWTSVIPVLKTLTETVPQPPPVGFILSWDDVFCRTRAWRWYALPGEGLQKEAAKVSLGNVPWISGITPYSVYKQQKMIVCDYDNQVFSPELLDKLEKFARGGGCLVMYGTAGEYTVGSKKKYLWREKLNGKLLGNGSRGTKIWKVGKGQVVYSDSRATGKSLLKMMKLIGIRSEVETDSPEVQGFLLKNKDELVLVVSAYKGFDRLRKLSKTITINTFVRLPSITGKEWQITQVFPSRKTEDIDSSVLKNKGIKVSLEQSGLIIYKLKSI